MLVKTRHTGPFRIGCWVPAMILDASARSANAVRLMDAHTRTIPYSLPSHHPFNRCRPAGPEINQKNAYSLMKSSCTQYITASWGRMPR